MDNLLELELPSLKKPVIDTLNPPRKKPLRKNNYDLQLVASQNSIQLNKNKDHQDINSATTPSFWTIRYDQSF